MDSDSADDRVRFLFGFPLRRFSHSLPYRTANIRRKPNELLLPYVERDKATSWLLSVNERKANGEDLVRFANEARQIAIANRFVDW